MATDQTPLFIDQTYPYVKPPLPYAFDALEPYIDAKTMEIHYTKYLQNYIDNLNRILQDEPTLQMMPLDQLIVTAQQMRVSVGRPILRNAGGILNHIFVL